MFKKIVNFNIVIFYQNIFTMNDMGCSIIAQLTQEYFLLVLLVGT